jgi:hypothetical protein
VVDYGQGRRHRISLFWFTAPNDPTPWLKYFLRSSNEHPGSFVLPPHRIEPNKKGVFYAVAGVESTFEMYPVDDHELAPIVLGPLKLQQGQVMDLGEQKFQPAITVKVKVTDKAGQPVAGVTVIRSDDFGFTYGRGSITDSDGQTSVYVPPRSTGKFIVTYRDPQTGRITKDIREDFPYQIAGPEEVDKEFTLVLPALQ